MNSFPEDLSACPACGMHLETKESTSAPTQLNNNIDYLVDMHQIIPKEEGIMEQQLKMMEIFRIKWILLQSVPTKVSSLYNNADMRGLKEKYPDKFLISQFMDPRHPIARRKIGKYAKNEAKVIKLLPCLGYEPDNRKFDKFWRKMEQNKQVAMVHTGFITARHKQEEKKNNTFLNSRYGNPLYFDKVARKFPELQIILCHMGGAIWYEEATQMINQHENVWGDCSGFGIFALQRIFANDVKIKENKIFWGNDSHPRYYATNLNLMITLCKNYQKEHLLKKLLQSNGEKFINTFLK